MASTTTDPHRPETCDSSNASTSGDSPHQMNLFESMLWERLDAVATDLGGVLHQQARSKGFWDDTPSPQSTALRLYLIASEAHEAAEVVRADPYAPSSKTPGYTALEEECADILIRLLDFCAAHNLHLCKAAQAKAAYNRTRPTLHGKQF